MHVMRHGPELFRCRFRVWRKGSRGGMLPHLTAPARALREAASSFLFPAVAMQKKFVWIGLFVGSTVGGMVPGLWGAGLFSGWGVLFSLLGGLAGIWAGFKAGQRF